MSRASPGAVKVLMVRRLLPSVSGENGQALLLFAGALVGVLALVGMSVDVGLLVLTRTDLQKTVDAAAFAGAQDLPDSEQALSTANAYVASNGGQATSAVVAFGRIGGKPNSDTIRVTATRRVDYTFFRVLGLRGTTVSASATVEVDTTTGYVFDETDVFPYAVWGGARHGTPNGCPYGVCVGSVQVFRSNHYERDTGALAPDWDVNGENFKGYFHAGGNVVQIAPTTWQTFSRGGNAIGEEPIDALLEHAANGRPILLPVIAKASCRGGCGNIDFKIVAWVAVMLDRDFSVNPSGAWTGTVVPPGYAISKGSTTGPVQPPDGLATRTFTLTE